MSTDRRRETRDQLLSEARRARERIEEGIALLESDPVLLEAFRLANRAMAMAARARNPERYDVIVCSNLFGDILTDLGAMLQGGMGMAAGGNINPEKDFPSMFEPIHGSAPDIAFKGIVNPVASIESIRLMMEHLGEMEAARDIERAVTIVMKEDRIRTVDLGGNSKTQEVGDEIAGDI